MPEQDLPDQDPKAFNRRSFLRRAALTGVATAWVAPVVQSIAATPAFAQTVDNARPGGLLPLVRRAERHRLHGRVYGRRMHRVSVRRARPRSVQPSLRWRRPVRVPLPVGPGRRQPLLQPGTLRLAVLHVPHGGELRVHRSAERADRRVQRSARRLPARAPVASATQNPPATARNNSATRECACASSVQVLRDSSIRSRERPTAEPERLRARSRSGTAGPHPPRRSGRG